MSIKRRDEIEDIFKLFSTLCVNMNEEAFEEYLEQFKERLDDVDQKKRSAVIKSFLLKLRRDISPPITLSDFSVEHKTHLFQIIEFLEDQQKVFTNLIPPIRWLGTPGEWGVIMERLADEGYIEHDRKNNEIIYNRLAKSLLPHFKFNNANYDDKQLADYLSRKTKATNDKFTIHTFKIPAK